MIEERALVLESIFDETDFSHKMARVKVQRTNACESCSLKSGCGQSALTKLSSNQCLELDVENNLGANPGDEVLIAIPESGLMSASLRVYFIPLILMVLGAVVGGVIDPLDESWTMILSVVGLIVGFAWARFSSQKQAFDTNFLPKITRVTLQSSTISMSDPT
jgi:sigma-E factor negative regulatory protein RseC|tara:strand:- start:25 stop:513 length:489 start_codon:yes stop_codon:yes gene_type:complete